jgi:hypothetical protein
MNRPRTPVRPPDAGHFVLSRQGTDAPPAPWRLDPAPDLPKPEVDRQAVFLQNLVSMARSGDTTEPSTRRAGMVISDPGQTTAPGTAKKDFWVILLVVFRNAPASRGFVPPKTRGVEATRPIRPPPTLFPGRRDTFGTTGVSALSVNISSLCPIQGEPSKSFSSPQGKSSLPDSPLRTTYVIYHAIAKTKDGSNGDVQPQALRSC